MNTPEINDGGPAFPTPDSYDSQTQKSFRTPGMSLRDWFAGQALQGMRAARYHTNNEPHPINAEMMADLSYQDADAMIAQRNKK